MNSTMARVLELRRQCAPKATRGSYSRNAHSRFTPEHLPDPEAFYAEALGKLHGRGRWRTATCCFHKDASPSLSINIEHGGYRCHGCGASGDMISFYRQLHDCGFAEAAKALGAWRET